MKGTWIVKHWREEPLRPRSLKEQAVSLCVLGLLVLGLTACGEATATTKTTSAKTPSAVDDFNAAQGWRGASHCDRAVPYYLRALTKNGMYVNAYAGLGYCYQALGKPNAAIIQFDKAIQIDPNNWNLYYQRAGAEVQNGSNGAAMNDLLYALRLAPPQAPTYSTIASAFHDEINDYVHAIEAMNKAIAVASGTPSLYIQRGQYYQAASDLNHAYADYRNALKVAPFGSMRADVDTQLAGLYLQQGDYSSAFKAMDEAIRLEPDNTHYYVLAGDVHRSANHFTEAIHFYNEALRVARGDDAEAAHEGKGDAYASLGQAAAAISEYTQASKFTKNRDKKAALKAKIASVRASQ